MNNLIQDCFEGNLYLSRIVRIILNRKAVEARTEREARERRVLTSLDSTFIA